MTVGLVYELLNMPVQQVLFSALLVNQYDMFCLEFRCACIEYQLPWSARDAIMLCLLKTRSN